MTGILLTGATGFVGRAVTRALADTGLPLRCVIRTGSSDRLDPAAKSAECVETDNLFTNMPDWWAETCDGIDLVIHTAWYTEPGKSLTSVRNLECQSGTLALARGAAAASVRRFVGVGTCFEYDLSVGRLGSNARLDPQTTYASAKVGTFLTLHHWLPLQSVEFLWARLFYLYGEGEDARRLVPYLHQKMQIGEPAELTSGEQIRDFMDVNDAARLLVSDALGSQQGPVNICSEVPITIRALCETIADQYGRRDLLNFGARHDNLTDPPSIVGLRGGAQ
jgi:nucleoside-diphosphate-sugar epimerase